MAQPVEGHRVSVTPEQVKELNLAENFNPAKTTSKQYPAFVKKTGGDKTWEVEALPHAYLVEQVRSAVEANLDMDIFWRGVAQEDEDVDEISRVRAKIAGELSL